MTRLLLGLSALGLLAGCGIPGGLERPNPMWNADEAIHYECTRPLRRNEVRDARCNPPAAAPAQTQANGPSAPLAPPVSSDTPHPAQ